jgi:hypothetical protein
MSWRLHLTNQAVHHLDILDGEPKLLAAWSRLDRVVYYELETGALYGEQKFDMPVVENRSEDGWQDFIAALVAPNAAHLPYVRTPTADMYATDDGRMRLYQNGGGTLTLEDDGKEAVLDVKEGDAFRAVAFDRFLGLVVAIDDQAQMHVYQQHIRVGVFDLGLKPHEDLPLSVAISRGGGAIFVSDGRRIVLTDSSGRVRQCLETHYFIGRMTCSPDGHFVISSDIDTSVLRIYNGGDLSLAFQRFAIDLVADATQVQLIADLPPATVRVNALAIDDNGVVAFAMSGVICVTETARMDSLPRPQALL